MEGVFVSTCANLGVLITQNKEILGLLESLGRSLILGDKWRAKA